MRGRLALLVLLTLGFTASVVAGEVRQREPGPKAKAKIYEWKTKDGLVYQYFVPKGYSADEGANVTLVLHGSNLDRRWGFANHKAGGFRPDDIMVCPDGTTPNGRGGFNFLGKRPDADRLHGLIEELRKALTIRDVYLYGHSQGSFFALHYAGEYPKDVAGLVAHASGVWTWTQLGPRSHHQAIVLVHGTQDPVVPYPQSVGGQEALRKAKYPNVRLRSLEGWNHWPAEHNGPVPHTSQQLAWCEGMTTTRPDRLAACLEVLLGNKSRERHDYAALYTFTRRLEGLSEAPADLKRRAAAAAEKVERLAQAHVAALSLSDDLELTAEPWVGHLPVFLRSFADVPARDALAEKLEKTLEKHRKIAIKHLREYYRQRAKKPAAAFAAGVAAVRAGFLYHECADRRFLSALKEWSKQARDLRLPKKTLKTYAETVPVFEKALEEGYRAFDAVNRKKGKL